MCRRRRRSRSSSSAPRRDGAGPRVALAGHVAEARAAFRRRFRRGAAEEQRAAPRARHLAALPLEGVIDLSAEAKRLDKEIEKNEAEVKKLDAKLSNEGFLAKAEEEVIDEHRERRDTALARIETLKAARARLG